jgi:uncharacterized oligopeptide transporter (OPT) family protein
VPAIEVNPALLGVGYIIGTRISCIMVAGGVLASFVLIPAIRFFGDPLATSLYPGTVPIAQMDQETITEAYVLYIGAGAVAAGGIISLVQALPLIASSIQAGFRDIRQLSRTKANGEGRVKRTDDDIPLPWVAAGSLLLLLAIWVCLPLSTMFSPVNLAAAVLIVLFGFLFVTVSSRLTGEIGSSSNPISGMTVATLLLTCLIFFLLGWTDSIHRLLALTVAAIVCVASSNGGTTSQDLKTGYLIGATPRYQQWAILAGSITSALAIGWILIWLNEASTVYSNAQENMPKLQKPLDVARLTETAKAPGDSQLYHVWRATEGNDEQASPGKYLVDDAGRVRYLVDPGINGHVDHRPNGMKVQKYLAPKARLMAIITYGILSRKLPWSLVLIGVSIALVLELCGVPSLPFAVGVYLPLSSSTPIFAGGLIRYLADKWGRSSDAAAQKESASDMSPGVLLSTGYIAGGAIGGLVVAFLSFSNTIPKYLEAAGASLRLPPWDSISLAAFGGLVAMLVAVGLGRWMAAGGDTPRPSP